MKVETLKLGLGVLNSQFPIFTLGGSLSSPKPYSGSALLPPASIAILLRATFAFSARLVIHLSLNLSFCSLSVPQLSRPLYRSLSLFQR